MSGNVKGDAWTYQRTTRRCHFHLSIQRMIYERGIKAKNQGPRIEGLEASKTLAAPTSEAIYTHLLTSCLAVRFRINFRNRSRLNLDVILFSVIVIFVFKKLCTQISVFI
jgi:hypothetical protein